jgi:uncharacterized protein YbjT (DUF2867 family)
MTAFVAGATGYTGQEVVRQLVQAGVRTIAHVRPDSRALADWKQRFSQQGAEPDATAWTVPAMTDTLRRVMPDVVFCLVGTTMARMQALSRSGGDPNSASYEAVDFGLTDMLVRSVRGAGLSPRFVYLSAIGAGPDARGAYMKWRTRAESAVLESGLPYTIVRPAIISGPDRDEKRTAERLANVLLDGALNLGRAVGLTNPWRKYRSIDGAALAKALIRLAMSPEGKNRVVEREGLDEGP